MSNYDDLSIYGALADAVRLRVEQAYLWGVREGMRVQARADAEAISRPANNNILEVQVNGQPNTNENPPVCPF